MLDGVLLDAVQLALKFLQVLPERPHELVQAFGALVAEPAGVLDQQSVGHRFKISLKLLLQHFDLVAFRH